MKRLGWMLGLMITLGLVAGPVWAQGSVQILHGQKGSSAAPNIVTGEAVDANTEALHIFGKGGTIGVTGTVTANQGTAAAGSGAWPITITTTGDTVVKPGDSGNNAMRVNCVVGCGGSSFADNSAFTFGTTAIQNMGAVVDDAATNAVTENSSGTPRMSTNRILYTALRRSDGTESIGQQTMANSHPVAIASNQSAIPVTQSGTWTVQPGNTPNTTPWLVIQGGATAVVTGQQSVTASAVALATNSVKGCVVVKALLTNIIPVYYGPSGVTTSTGHQLQPGDVSPCLHIDNTDKIRVIASTTGASVSWSGVQ